MRNLIIVALIILAFSCTKIDSDYDMTYDVPVVSGFLSPNNLPVVQISELIIFDSETSDTTYNFEGLEVYLLNNGVKYQLNEVDNKPGQYQYTDTLLSINAGEEYYLEFLYKDVLVSSNTKVPFKPENFEKSQSIIEVARITEESGGGGPGSISETLELGWNNSDNGFYLVKYEYLENEYDLVNETIDIENPEELANVTSTPIQDNQYSIKAIQFNYFGEYNIILFKITEEYAVIYESLNQSSLEDLTEPVTNITNGKGVFASFNSDTLQVRVVED